MPPGAHYPALTRVADAGFPEPREARVIQAPDPSLAGPPPGGVAGVERYARMETVRVTLADTDTPVEVGRFSGVPDAIELSCINGAVRVTLADEHGRDEQSYLLEEQGNQRIHISRRVVSAARFTAAQTPTISATALWRG